MSIEFGEEFGLSEKSKLNRLKCQTLNVESVPPHKLKEVIACAQEESDCAFPFPNKLQENPPFFHQEEASDKSKELLAPSRGYATERQSTYFHLEADACNGLAQDTLPSQETAHVVAVAEHAMGQQNGRIHLEFTHLAEKREWISSGGMVSPGTASAVAEECERMLRIGDRAGRTGYDKKKLLLYSIVSGSRQQIDRLLRDLPMLFNTIEDFLWFKLAVVHDTGGASSSLAIVSDGLAPYSLEDLQNYLNKFEPAYYTKNGKDPLVYPYVLLLSIQPQLAVQYLTKELSNEGFNIDAVHISIALADHGVLSEGMGSGHKLGIMDAVAEIASIIRHYGSLYVRQGNLSLALEYYAQAAAAMGGGAPSWTGHSTVDQQRQRYLMLKQLLTEILLQEGGIALLLGPSGTGSEGALRRFLPERQAQHHFLLEAARRCQDSGLYDKVTFVLHAQFIIHTFFTLYENHDVLKANDNNYRTLLHANAPEFGGMCLIGGIQLKSYPSPGDGVGEIGQWEEHHLEETEHCKENMEEDYQVNVEKHEDDGEKVVPVVESFIADPPNCSMESVRELLIASEDEREESAYWYENEKVETQFATDMLTSDSLLGVDVEKWQCVENCDSDWEFL